VTLYQFEERKPKIGKGSYIFPSADVIGDVEIGEGCFVEPGVRLRGDHGAIKIGDYTNIQDNCVIHTEPGGICAVGNHVTVGHNAVIHGATIGDRAVIGMCAVVSDNAVVGDGSLIGEGAVVPSRMKVPGGKILVGVPARVLSDVDEEQREYMSRIADSYRDLAMVRYPHSLKKIEIR